MYLLNLLQLLILQSQWEALFRLTGFRLTATYPTRSPFTVTEARGI
jgi:hypothetical protein